MAMEKITFDGHTYTAEDITVMRDEMIGWRDASMEQWPDAIPFTVSASHLIAFLSKVMDQYPGE